MITAWRLIGFYITDASKLGDDAIVNQRTILCTSLNEIAGLTKDCIEGICLLHNKRSDLRKLLLLKLAFSMEQIIILPKIMLEIQCLEGNKDSDPIYFSVFKFCTNCMQTILNDSNVQVLKLLCVQRLGLQACFYLQKTEIDNEKLLGYRFRQSGCRC